MSSEEVEIRISHIRSWDQLEKTSWKYGCEVWFTPGEIHQYSWKRTAQNLDTQQVIREHLKSRGAQGVDWKLQKFNMRMIVEFQDKKEWMLFLLVFK